MSSSSKAALHFTSILAAYGIPNKPLVVVTDNTGAYNAVRSWTQTPNTKHIEVQHNFMRERYAAGQLDYQWIPGDQNVADVLTKPLGGCAFAMYRKHLSVVLVPSVQRS